MRRTPASNSLARDGGAGRGRRHAAPGSSGAQRRRRPCEPRRARRRCARRRRRRRARRSIAFAHDGGSHHLHRLAQVVEDDERVGEAQADLGQPQLVGRAWPAAPRSRAPRRSRASPRRRRRSAAAPAARRATDRRGSCRRRRTGLLGLDALRDVEARRRRRPRRRADAGSRPRRRGRACTARGRTPTKL